MNQPLDARQVTIGDTGFELRKLTPWETFRLSGIVRPVLPSVDLSAWAGIFSLPANNSSLVKFLGSVTFASAIPENVFEQVRLKLFEHIFFKSADAPTAQVLKGNEEIAFKDLEGVHVYEMMARSLYVNFSGWWPVIKEMVPELEQVIAEEAEEATAVEPSPTPE